jgi:hypothetical protein|tara:strand:+ start:43 stop:471 length:429 start_codon:yes stop_codon:yes gene_type:complete
VPTDLTLFLTASIISVLSNWAAWNFVWKSESESSNEEKMGILDKLFWFGFSYLLPFLPTIFVLIGNDGSKALGPSLTNWSLGILSGLLGFLMGGVAMSSWAYYRKNGTSSLKAESAKHFKWTTSLTTLAGLCWLFILLSRLL